MKDLFSGSLGRVNNHGGARMYTTPHTIGVQPEYEVETDIPSVAEFVTCTLDGRIWVYRRSRRYYIAVFRWDDVTEKLVFVSSIVLSNLNILGRGIDWILTDTMVIQASDNEPYIHTANLFADSNTTFLYSILRSSVFSEKPTGFRINTGSGVDPVTKDAWGKSEDNGNLEGDGYFNRSTLIQSVDKQYSLLPAVGDWNIIKNFLIRRVSNSSENDTSSDNPSDNVHNSMLSIRPLIPLEFNYYSSDISIVHYSSDYVMDLYNLQDKIEVLDSYPSYGTGYEHDIGLTYFYGLETLKAQEQQSRIVGQIWGRGLMHIGRCYILPAVFNENGTPEEFYLYISPDFLCSPYNIKEDISPQSNDEWLKIGLFCANEKSQYGFLAEHADSLNNGLCLTSETPKLLKLYSKKVSDDTEGKEDTGEQGGSEGEGQGGSSGQGGSGEQGNTDKTEDTEDDGNSGDDEGNSEGQGSGGSEGSGGSSGSEGSDKPEGSETPEGSEGEQEGSGGQSSEGQETGGESSEGEGTPEGQEATEEEKITEWKELSENGKLFIDPFNKKYLALQENSAILFKGDTTSEDSNVEDNPVDDSSAEGNSANDNSVYECQGLQKWLAPAMQVDAISDDVIISSCDNNALTTHIQQEFFRELLTANRLPVSASLFADKRISLGENTSRNRKNIKVNAIKSDINASPIAWEDIYKNAVEMNVLTSFNRKFSLAFGVPLFVTDESITSLIRGYKVGDRIYPTDRINGSNAYAVSYAPGWGTDSHGNQTYPANRCTYSVKGFYINPNNGEIINFDSKASFSGQCGTYDIGMLDNDGNLIFYDDWYGYHSIARAKIPTSTIIRDDGVLGIRYLDGTCINGHIEYQDGFRPLLEIPLSTFNWQIKPSTGCTGNLFLKEINIPENISEENITCLASAVFSEKNSNTKFLFNLPSIFKSINGTASGILANVNNPSYSFYNYWNIDSLSEDETTYTQGLHIVIINGEDFTVFRSELHPEIFNFNAEVERSKLF